MPTSLPDKLFFKIGEVAQLVGVRPHVLRYWESEFSALKPMKTRGAHRVYRRQDVELSLLIRRLLQEEGYTIPGAKRRLREMGKARVSESKVRANEPLDTHARRELDLRAELIGLRGELTGLLGKLEAIMGRATGSEAADAVSDATAASTGRSDTRVQDNDAAGSVSGSEVVTTPVAAPSGRNGMAGEKTGL